jgi:hypothetical protein
LFNGTEAADDAKMLYTHTDFTWAANTRRVHEFNLLPAVAHGGAVDIPRGASAVGNNGLLFFSEGVKQLRLPHVWSAEQGYTEAFVVIG